MKTEKFFFHGILQGRYENEKRGWLMGYQQFTRGYSTMVMDKNSMMLGTIADVPVSEIPELDLIEGVPSFYIRFKTKVVDEDENWHNAWVYQQAEDRINDLGSK